MDVRGPIDAYLDKLLVELQGPGHQIRRILAEVEDHLTEAAAAGVADGLEPRSNPCTLNRPMLMTIQTTNEAVWR